MGVLPTELLARDANAPVVESRMPSDSISPGKSSIREALKEYRSLCVKYFDGEVAAAHAPVPEDFLARARNLKASTFTLGSW